MMGWTRQSRRRDLPADPADDPEKAFTHGDAFEYMPVACSVLDVTARQILAANAACRAEIGAPDSLGARASVQRLCDLIERHDARRLVDHELVRSNGTITSLHAVPLPSPDGHTVLLLMSRDITAERASQARAQQLAERLADVQNVNDAMKAAAGTTRELSASIQLIATNAAAASHTATVAVHTAKDAMRAIQRLDEFSTAIAAIVGVIDAIAGQTNLLALNATIEAARAGEAGRSFSVVATEVKELARATNAATEQIRQMVTNIRTETTATMAVITETTTVIEQIHELQTTIAAAVEEQHAATSGISEHIAHAAQQTDTVAVFLRDHTS